jgi:hypothetical protein
MRCPPCPSASQKLSGTKLHYDERATRFINNDEANKLLNPVFRSGWSL